MEAFKDNRFVCSAISLIAETICPIDFDFSSNSSIEVITFLVISAVDSALFVKLCTDEIPALMVSPVIFVSFSISSAFELTLLIFPESESI